VVVTDANDWGGWRVPGAEYDRDPHKIEFQARLLTMSPRLLTLARQVVRLVEESNGAAPQELQALAAEVVRIDRYLKEVPAASEAEPAANVA
jgi:hypothetical protein